ncbi:MAG: hypothetical protein ETSY1_45285 [Candidatus Entotheonella factor]|uniref:Uncharacterized protein n=1 Tax=Entotheonella factor TaxID=1429438 RepID=W4L409_ENTF1|nr:MAG: hypothetical protein ETSY1_45285 [Candidatus Entotheonella factor]
MNTTYTHKEPSLFPVVRNGVVYDILKIGDVSGASRCLAITFSTGEPMAKSLGITEEEFLVFAEILCKRAVKEELSIIARCQKTDHIIGCCIAEDFTTEILGDLKEINPNFIPIFALLNELDEKYKKQHMIQKNEILHGLMLGVLKTYSRLDIGKNLTELVCALGKARGYKAAITEATSPITQHMAI